LANIPPSLNQSLALIKFFKGTGQEIDFIEAHKYPATAWESMFPISACHALCNFTTKLHGCSLSFMLYRSLISNTARAEFSFTHGA
jgi:hypothetical protein